MHSLCVIMMNNYKLCVCERERERDKSALILESVCVHFALKKICRNSTIVHPVSKSGMM